MSTEGKGCAESDAHRLPRAGAHASGWQYNPMYSRSISASGTARGSPRAACRLTSRCSWQQAAGRLWAWRLRSH